MGFDWMRSWIAAQRFENVGLKGGADAGSGFSQSVCRVRSGCEVLHQ
jgi:hypothetical protein